MLRGRMFKGCWLLSDLDGTLLPTPHKAHGEYRKLTESSVYPALKGWFSQGGNLCVITTADKRVFEQVYFPIKSQLKSRADPISPSNASGELLLSLYTGAVLYRCTREGIDELPGYCDPTLPLDKRDTCFNEETCNKLTGVILEIYLKMVEDSLHGRAPLTPGWEKMLSHRYQLMWASILKHLRNRLDERKAYLREDSPKRSAQRFAHLDHLIHSGNDTEWMVQYIRDQRQLLVNVGIIRRETLKSQDELDEMVKLRCLGSNEVHSSSIRAKMAREESHKMGETSSAMLQAAPGYRAKRFAQLIVVGVPIKLHEHYFRKYYTCFSSLGVNPIAQPNSVVFSFAGVSKGTTVNYLDRSLVASGEAYPHFRASVDFNKSLSLGDNPHSADRELALFPHLPFISFERTKQRSVRLDEIDRLNTYGLLDDRQMAHMRYVGNEEDGCANFLDTLTSIVVERKCDSQFCRQLTGDEFRTFAFEAAEKVRLASSPTTASKL